MLSWTFLTEPPRNGMTEGGIMPALLGTIILTFGTAIVSFPLSIATAIYLAEYAGDNRLTRWIRMAIVNLAGIPSIVYGLFGLGMFVLFLDFGTSILAGSLTLGIMTMPVVISTAEEAILAVPQQFRTVSLSLGASRWQTIRHQVLPHAMPGIITGIILGLGRAAGETAPILFTVAAFYLPEVAAIDLRPDDGAALSPLRHRYAGARDAAADSVRRGAGAAADRAFVYAGRYPGAHADAPPPRMVRL
jgi:phosphate transport system permease protein